MTNVVNGNRLQNIRFGTKENKTFFLNVGGPTQICLLLISKDINVPAVKEALDVTVYSEVEWLTATLILRREGPRYAGMLAVTEDISLSDNDALDETQVGNKINMSYDMTYFSKTRKTINSWPPDKPIYKYLYVIDTTNLGKHCET